MSNQVHPELPAQAMVLAAGYGKRLGPVTRVRPKPLVSVAGRPVIDRVLDRLSAAGVTRCVVNLHYKGEMLRAHLERRETPEIEFSHEEELLDTGGGVLNALHRFGGEPFLSVNSDTIWRDAFGDSFRRLGRAWDPERMDVLLLMQPTVTAIGYRGQGDFTMTPSGRLTRRRPGRLAPFLYAGIQILHPRIFEGLETVPFSLNLIFDRAAEAGRLYGMRHEGDWIDIGTPDGLERAEALLRRTD